ncbi:hypothetical protein D6D20_03194 [Aureobasidium pullulans]|uniref:Uncharacterized protein n=1 Tax=Aureobasidium pullulans TaxID=5580 RepID=A0A4S9Z0F3_AURPU|nr:hypothetical protein D6D20_03194 [Aureobasidium pullulans]TIA00029.1 hypothetical protein D6C82_04772 [Aureobasidium pullulans]
MDAASPAHRVGGRLALSDPSVQRIAQASCSHDHYNDLPKLQGEANWQEWSDALQDAALMAGTEAVLNGESSHPSSLEGKQSTTAEWNDNIKRTAVWRCRNESLLKAMRNTLDFNINIDNLGASNAHQTYLGLKSRYYVSDNQKAINLYNHELMLADTDLDDSPKEIADDFQTAFDQYNHLFDHNESQRLPENFLKIEFLGSLDIVYADWIKALMKEYDVLGLDQGPTLTFNGLVDLLVVERGRLLEAQKDTSAHASASHPSHQTAKRKISDIEDDSHIIQRVNCSLFHHQNHKYAHTNQQCYTQNHRLRPEGWKPSVEDKSYLAKHPQIEEVQSTSVSQDFLLSNDGDQASQDGLENLTNEGSDNSDIEQLNSTHDQGQEWTQLVETHRGDVKAQIAEWQRIMAENRSGGGHPRLSRGPMSGKWLLYAHGYNPGQDGHHHMQLWETFTVKSKASGVRHYQGNLSMGSHESHEVLQISTFTPPSFVTGNVITLRFQRSNGDCHRGSMIVWGHGKMRINVPLSSSDSTTGDLFLVKFAGVWDGPHLISNQIESEDVSQSDEDDATAGDGDSQEPETGAGDRQWIRWAQARMAEVEAQKVAATSSSKKRCDLLGRGPLSGLWRLYAPEYDPGETGHHYIKSWEEIGKRHKKTRFYRGELSTGPREKPRVYQITQIAPPALVKGTALTFSLKQQKHSSGSITLWGDGKLYLELSTAFLDGYNGDANKLKFAGIWSEAADYVPWRELENTKRGYIRPDKPRVSGLSAELPARNRSTEEDYNLILRTDQSSSVAVKVEEDTQMTDGAEEEDSSVIVKAEASDSDTNDSHDEWADDVATTGKAVQIQEDALRGGLISPLHPLPGKWYLHSADYNPGLHKEIYISFYTRQEHDSAERMCAPGHCKSTPAQIHYCGELRFKAPVGERDFHCLIKQFDVPKEASLVPVMLEMWDPLNKRTIMMCAWFFGEGKMRISISTLCIRDYRGQNTLITFDGLKYGWTSHAG